MRSRLAMLAFCAISACLPASHAAGRTVAAFDLAGTNGYTAFFEFSPQGASVDAIDLPEPLVLVSAAYFSRDRLEAGEGGFAGDRIRARFGSRGRVAVEFRPSGRARRNLPPRRCRGKPRVTQPGVFVGTIRFSGEDRYTTVDRSRARGAMQILTPWKCKRGKRARRAGLDPEAERFTVLAAESNDGRTSFSAAASRPRGRSGETTFVASKLESRRNLRIVRFAFAHGEDESFTFDAALSTAGAAPPSPFAGGAGFTRDPGGEGGSWLGALTVDFPGAADVPLAGASFHARLFHSDLFGSGFLASLGSGE